MRLAFADHVLNIAQRELSRGGVPVAIEPQVFDLLVYLVENRDRVVGKDELLAHVWRGRVVSDATIDSRVKAARQAVGDSGAAQTVIRTFARKGVRFVAETRQERAPILGGLERGGVADVSPATDAVLTLPDKPSIAVLPFANLSDDPEQEYFADGMVEEIITALSRIRWLFVIARNSTFTYKGQAVDIRQVGRELGVRYVLEGSVRKAGGRVRITAQLIEAETGAHVWSERFDRDLSDVFAVQDEITESIVANIEPRLYTAENFRAQRKPPEALDAWGLVMRALSLFWRVTRADNSAARALLEKAIAID
jgi:TolB-like protein